MIINKAYPIFLALFFTSFSIPLSAQPTQDGQLFDQGRTMTEKSPRAHEALDKMKGILGQWDVAITTYPTDSTTFNGKGMADIAYMNRGYAYMNRVHVPAIDEAENEANFIYFLNFSPANATWVLGEANSFSESVSMYNGAFKGKELHLSTAVRRSGSALLTMFRVEIAFSSKNKFSITTRTSTDNGDTWHHKMKQVYSRREASPDFMISQEGMGEPSPMRPAETEQFDFLIGTWNASHNINFNGQWVQFPANATAVHAMNGHAILEHNWYDVDPSLPDAATTIVRLYNRSMRRWESLYLDNRGNTPLFFGGQKEGDDIVLHNFESDTSNPSIPKYIFHDIAEDTYAWYAESSVDRGKTFNKTWNITFARK